MKHLLLTTIAAVVLVGCGNADNKPTREAWQYSSIHEAAKEGDLNAIKWFLHGGINVNTAGSFRNASPLYMAAYSYDYEAAKLLLSYAANVHQLDFEKETALHTAAYHSYVGKGDVKLIGLLIDHGANVNVVSDKRVTPLDWAMMFGTQEVADYLRKHGAKTAEELKSTEPIDKALENTVHEGAVSEGNIEPLNSMADGADVNEKSSSSMPTFFDVFFDITTKKPLLGVIFATFIIIILLFVLFQVNRHLRSRNLNLDRANKLNKISNMLNVDYCSDGKDKLDKHFLFSKISPENETGIISESVMNLMKGEVSNAQFTIFDLEYTTRHGGARGDAINTYKYTPIYFSSTYLNLPYFKLKPESLVDKIASVAHFNLRTFKSEYQDINFNSHPKFSKCFLLQGEDEGEIRAIFTDKLLDYFLTHQKITIEGKGNILIVYRDSFLPSDNRISPNQWTAFMNTAYQVFQQFAGSSEKLSLSDILKSVGK